MAENSDIHCCGNCLYWGRVDANSGGCCRLHGPSVYHTTQRVPLDGEGRMFGLKTVEVKFPPMDASEGSVLIWKNFLSHKPSLMRQLLVAQLRLRHVMLQARLLTRQQILGTPIAADRPFAYNSRPGRVRP
jgi:hypothetical protein